MFGLHASACILVLFFYSAPDHLLFDVRFGRYFVGTISYFVHSCVVVSNSSICKSDGYCRSDCLHELYYLMCLSLNPRGGVFQAFCIILKIPQCGTTYGMFLCASAIKAHKRTVS